MTYGHSHNLHVCLFSVCSLLKGLKAMTRKGIRVLKISEGDKQLKRKVYTEKDT